MYEINYSKHAVCFSEDSNILNEFILFHLFICH